VEFSTRLTAPFSQLRHETSGLSLHYNDLTFVHTRSWINVNTVTSAYQHLTTFAESCSPKHLKHIKRITLLDSSTDSLHERTISYLLTRKIWLTSSVGAFARNFPQTTVIVRLHLDLSQILSQRPIAFMDYQYQARHGSSPLLKAATTTNAQHVLRFQPLFDFERLANLRFSSTFKFDEEKAEEELRKKGTLTEDEISGTISMAKEMHENGI
jgi:hypothetical protein